MPAKHQYIDIRIPKTLSRSERREIADLVVERIVDRTLDGKDKDNKPFKNNKYSESYIKSLDFDNAGKSESNVNLKLSGDMLAALTLLDDSDGKIRIGFENGSEENARADGNIRGTYGKQRGSSKKARPFLGITPKELKTIIDMVISER